MRRVAAFVGLLGVSLLIASCASIRTTGPKTAYDYCVDDCDNDGRWCGNPVYPSACEIEYDACVASCDNGHLAARPAASATPSTRW